MAAPSDELREQGNEAFRNGDFLRAAASYTRALKVDPANAVLYSNRALALLKLNKLSKALADAVQCTTLDPCNGKGWFRRAQILETKGDLEQARGMRFDTERMQTMQHAIDVLKQGAAAAQSGDWELGQQIKAITRKLKVRIDGGKPLGPAPPTPASARSSGDGGLFGAVSILEYGSKTPSSAAEADALAFADSWMLYLQQQLQAHGGDLQPTVHFLPDQGTNTPESQHFEANVLGKDAFSDPTALTDFVNFLRHKAGELQARAVISIVPKSKVAFPQMWLHQLWPYSREQDGVFVQLQAILDPPIISSTGVNKAGDQGKAVGHQAKNEAKQGLGVKASAPIAAGAEAVTKLWFVRLGCDVDGSWRVRARHELPADLALLPRLLRK